jgi:hypothetical protein
MAATPTPKWYLEGFPNYFIAEDNQLYRIIKPEQLQLKKLSMKHYSKGYYFSGKFYTLTKLRTLLRKIEG